MERAHGLAGSWALLQGTEASRDGSRMTGRAPCYCAISAGQCDRANALREAAILGDVWGLTPLETGATPPEQTVKLHRVGDGFGRRGCWCRSGLSPWDLHGGLWPAGVTANCDSRCGEGRFDGSRIELNMARHAGRIAAVGSREKSRAGYDVRTRPQNIRE